MKNIFNIQTGYKNSDTNSNNAILTTPDESISLIFRYLLIGIIIIGILAIIFYTLLERKKTREMRISEEKFWKNIK
jgi:uncharacterized membrane protein YukC